jgi:hypothetical protein
MPPRNLRCALALAHAPPNSGAYWAARLKGETEPQNERKQNQK